MSNQILSQEEIDALMSAMDNGEVDLKQDPNQEPVVEEYQLTSQSAMPRNQFDALEEVNDKFTTEMDQFMSSSLQRPVGVEFVSTEVRKYGDFISGFSYPTSLNIFSMAPLIGSSLISFEANLVFSLIDCMFGGCGKTLDCVREFTFIEQRMVKKLVEEVLGLFQKAWRVIHDVKISLKKTETKPEFVHLVNPNERVLIMVFAIKGEEFSGNIHICLPYLMLEPIRDKLSSTHRRDSDVQHGWTEQLHLLLEKIPINITAELGKTVHTVREVLNLEVEDVLRLNTSPTDYVTLTVNGVPKFRGYPGVINGGRAVEIAKWIK